MDFLVVCRICLDTELLYEDCSGMACHRPGGDLMDRCGRCKTVENPSWPGRKVGFRIHTSLTCYQVNWSPMKNA